MKKKLPVPEILLDAWKSSNKWQVTESDDMNGGVDEPEEQWMTRGRELKYCD